MKRRLLAVLLATLCVLTSVSGYTYADATPVYTIDEAYVYPVLPGTDEWKALKDMSEKVAACDVPVTVLQNMTTEALAETVLTYPLLSCMLVYNSLEEGYAAVSSYFPGLAELEARPDAAAVLASVSSVSTYANDESAVLTPFFADFISVMCSEDYPGRLGPGAI